jgi:SAM-dependent methyltransferase
MDEREFDKFADEDEYYRLHASNVSASGEVPEFFHETKVKDLAASSRWGKPPPAAILDFGSGVGNSVPYFRKYFGTSELTCADVSTRSLDSSRARHPGAERYAQISGNRLPFPDNSFDVVFSACVFHHIEHAEHGNWLRELNRVAKPGGELFIYEHNPLNPLTVAAVRTCPFDENARLIHARTFSRRIANAHWSNVRVRYRIFFPGILAKLRAIEPYMYFVPFGAQYYVSAIKAASIDS